MAYTAHFQTGWESGNIMFPDANLSHPSTEWWSVVTADAYTGTYALRAGNRSHWFQVAPNGTVSEIYATIRVKPTPDGLTGTWAEDQVVRISAVLGDATIVEARFNATSKCYDVYVDGVLTASGTVAVQDAYHRVSVHWLIAASGTFETRIDGIPDISFSGDTLPGADADIDFVRVYGGAAGRYTAFDDFSIGAGGWPGALAFDDGAPEGDTAVTAWTESSGTATWSLLDERPASTADYIGSTATGQQSIVTTVNWSGSGLTIQEVSIYVQAWKDTASEPPALKIIDEENGGTTNVGGTVSVLTTPVHYFKQLATAPDGSNWDATNINTLNIGVESII